MYPIPPAYLLHAGREGGEDAQEEADQVEAGRLDDDHGLGRRRCLGAEGHARAAFYAFLQSIGSAFLLVPYTASFACPPSELSELRTRNTFSTRRPET